MSSLIAVEEYHCLSVHIRTCYHLCLVLFCCSLLSRSEIFLSLCILPITDSTSHIACVYPLLWTESDLEIHLLEYFPILVGFFYLGYGLCCSDVSSLSFNRAIPTLVTVIFFFSWQKPWKHRHSPSLMDCSHFLCSLLVSNPRSHCIFQDHKESFLSFLRRP